VLADLGKVRQEVKDYLINHTSQLLTR